MAATIAWCLMGAVMVGMALMYACLHRLVTQAYEDGRQDLLRRVPAAEAAVQHQEMPMEDMPATSAQPASEAAA